MRLPILEATRRQRDVTDLLQMFRVRGVGCLGEVEAARDHDRIVNQDDLVVGDGVLRIDERRGTSAGKKVGLRVVRGALALVQDVHSALV